MYKFLFFLFFAILLNTQALFSQNDVFNMSVDTAFNSGKVLGVYNNLRPQNKNNVSFNLKYSKRSISSQLSLNFDDHDKFSFDNSYVNYEKGIANLFIGKIDRIWSFSNKTSLILSSNSRPLEAISLKLKNKFDTNWLPSAANWSIELVNGHTKNSFNNMDSMLTGTRVVISPFEQLNFEIIQTAQWGDQTKRLYSTNIDALLFKNTNDGEASNINKMAGFGLSYSVPFKKNTYRFYSQVIGEDEAGSLPSCLAWMGGLELTAKEITYPSTMTLEIADTRGKVTENGFCGPNTTYNNDTYDYTNNNTTFGVPIDTEGTSLELFGQTALNNNLGINYSAKFLNINDSNYSQHRLSSKKSTGSITSLGVYWEKDGFDLSGSISYQNLILDKANISNGAILSLFTSVEF
jgi:hypothetical protein